MRYDRQELVIGKEGQKKLKDSHICIVGCGALGSVAASLLARAGIGKLTLIDRDEIHLHNLQRQFYTENNIGKLKVVALLENLKAINSSINIEVKPIDLDWKNINEIKADIILDGTDNFYTRFLIDEYCFKNKKTWIYTGAIKDKGSLLVITPESKYSFTSIYKDHYSTETCDTSGILNSTSVIMASMQVNEAMKLILGHENEEKLLQINLKNNSITKLNPINGKPEIFHYLNGEKASSIIKQCGEDSWNIKHEFDYENTKSKLSKIGNIEDKKYYFKFKNMKFFKDNRIVIYSDNKDNAKTLISQYLGN